MKINIFDLSKSSNYESYLIFINNIIIIIFNFKYLAIDN